MIIYAIKIFPIKKTLEPECIVCLPGIPPSELASEIHRYLYRTNGMAALIQMMRNWLKPTPPSLNSREPNVNNILEMERIIYRIGNQ